MEQASARHILVAVDGSDNSRRAVEHVAEVLAGTRGFRFTLLHVVAEPDPDYFANDPAKRLEWIANQRSEAIGYLEEYSRILAKAGIDPAAITEEVQELRCPSLAQCILDECTRRGAGVLVLGRQGRGAREELLLGSVSKAAVHNSKGRAVWVVT
ncbi:universal stress protein [Fundidesulfovibrio terrae]|uniref:universal stress protein n=1 Tax=Fundidesulfovibrio terrae TaxID=2922866 RepID=UPI001FAF88B5|nr:universal stress protein [Fundidesulfovibrio terrae]